ncbi:MAG TPA: toll/interleukin-1 receptor domain-containing protein [Allosphingosinicella sp.]
MTETTGHIFLSHGSENRDEADGLTRYLEERGLRVWIAPRDVRPGVDYSEALQQAIENCAAFVVLVTDKANRSPYVRVETEMAFSLHKPIFPIRTSDVKPGPGLALFLKIRHWTDAYGPQRDDSLERLARELRSIAGLPDAAPPAAGRVADPAAAAQIASPPPPAAVPPQWEMPPSGSPPLQSPGPVRPHGGMAPLVMAGGGLLLLVLVGLFFLLRPSGRPADPVPQAVPQPGGQAQQGQGQPQEPIQPGQPSDQEGDIYYTPPDSPGDQSARPPAEQQQEPPTEGHYDPPQ